jgi:hypothetical protein
LLPSKGLQYTPGRHRYFQQLKSLPHQFSPSIPLTGTSKPNSMEEPAKTSFLKTDKVLREK